MTQARCCRPDSPSEWIGIDSFSAARWQRYLLQNTERPTRLLVPGVGCGIIVCSYLAQVECSQDDPYANGPLHIDAFDINSDALEAAAENIERYAESLPNVTFDLWQGDWEDDELWAKFKPASHDAIALNPPHLPEGRTVLDGYVNSPSVALYAGKDGLEAYRQLLPRFAKSLSPERGASIIGRYSSTSSGDHDVDVQTYRLESILRAHMDVESDEASLRMLPAEGPCDDEDKWMSLFVYQRGVPWSSNQFSRVDGLHWLAKTSIEFAEIFHGEVIPERVAVDLSNITHGYRLDHESRAKVVRGLLQHGSLTEMPPEVLAQFKVSIDEEASGYVDQAIETHARFSNRTKT